MQHYAQVTDADFAKADFAKAGVAQKAAHSTSPRAANGAHSEHAPNETAEKLRSRLFRRLTLVSLSGLEPETYGLKVRCSNQLSYRLKPYIIRLYVHSLKGR